MQIDSLRAVGEQRVLDTLVIALAIRVSENETRIETQQQEEHGRT